MNAQTPTRDDLSDSRNDTEGRTQFSREESTSQQKKSATKRVESSYFSPKVNRDPSSQVAQSPSENKFQQFPLNSNIRLESKESEKDRQEEVQQEKPKSRRSKPNSKYKDHKQKGSGRNKDQQNQELINIKVSPSKNKNSKKHYKSTVENETDRSLHAEIWREGNAHREILSTQSVFDSDVADEIDYEFDPEYICRLNQRYISPNLKKKHPKDHSLGGSQYSQSPQRGRKGHKKEIQYNLNIDGNQDTGDILHQACKQISSVKCSKKKQKHFVKRMQYDVDKRESRERTMETLKDNLLVSKSSPGVKDSGQAIHVSQLSPHSLSKFSQNDTPQKFDITSDNLGLTVSSTKKLTKREALEIYERTKQFEERKMAAIQMMQQAQLKKEQMEIAAKSVGKGKKSDTAKQACCDRLNNDADRRKEKLRKKKEQELMKLEQECQDYFKPKINQKYKIRREHVMSAENLLSGKKEYSSKIERFQVDAQQRGMVRGPNQDSQNFEKSRQSLHNAQEQESQQVEQN